MKAKIYVTLKKGVFDPQGVTVKNTLSMMNFKTVESVSQGKYFEILLQEEDKQKAKDVVETICKDFLSNPVIEDYSYELSSE